MIVSCRYGCSFYFPTTSEFASVCFVSTSSALGPITNCQDTLRTRSYNLTFFFSVLGRAIGRVMSQPAVMSRTTGRLSTIFLTALPYADLQAQYKVRDEIQKRRLAI